MKMKLMVALSLLTFTVNVTAFPAPVIKAEEGDDVLLECPQNAKIGLEDSVVEWRKDDHNQADIVHYYRDGQDYLKDQMEEFRNRTALSHEGLKQGNVILQLRSVRLSDGGTYRCYVKKLGPDRPEIILKVAQKGQNKPTQDVSSAPLPVEAATEPTEPTDPDGGNMTAVSAGVAFCAGLLIIIIGVFLFKCGIIKKLRGKN